MSGWSFKMLVDFDCPLCKREATILERMDRGRGHLIFENIAAANFEASMYGKTQDEVMGSIHGVLPDGSVVHGMEVFRRAYTAVGYGWLLAPTAWPGLRCISDTAYR